VNTTQKGRRGEADAAAYLEAQDYRILQKNFKSRGGEVDIIAVRDDSVVFVEVKAWDSMPFSELRRAVDRRKRGRIRMAAQEYLRRYPVLSTFRRRFELLFLTAGGRAIRHINVAVGE
jgi:putative endonuclease